MSKETKAHVEPATMPAGGWGSVGDVTNAVLHQGVALKDTRLLLKQNKPDGYACVSCAWAKPADPHPFEFCSSGAKATAWETTSKTIGADFFERHTLTELEAWGDHELEDQGRLTLPLRYDAASDKYRPVEWDTAFAEIGAHLRAFQRDKVVFYASGRASLETSYMYQLLARMYGNNNLPDSSNMCHESTSVGLQKTLGVGVGTVHLNDFKHTDCILFFGQNVGVNSPRMLHQLQEARERGVPIITFNPLRERGLVSFTNPQSPLEMLTGKETAISTQYHQVKPGGDTAAMMGMCKTIFALDDAAIAAGEQRVIDTAFIMEHTHGFDRFEAAVRAASWHQIEQLAGLRRADIEAAAEVYCKAGAALGVYGMGLTQHSNGVQNVTMLVNLLLLRGNIGKSGAGICPVRGHSNVQGQRTVGITEKPELAPLDKLKEQYGFEPPREEGLTTVDACEAIIKRELQAFIGLGGNFLRAVPETRLMEAAWRELPLSVQVATKLNRNHVIHGKAAYLLPCLGRIEVDRQASGEQAVTVEDSTSCMHGSRGMSAPAAPELLSEPAIVAGIAKAVLDPNPRVDWDGWVADSATIRDSIEETYPSIFKDFNARMWTPGGFRKPLGAAERVWDTESGKAEFTTPQELAGTPGANGARMTGGADVLRLFTIRSDGQFNTTIYSYDDRFRGVQGSRMVLFMAPADIEARGLVQGDVVTLHTATDDGVERRVDGLAIVPYDVPAGCIAGYYPECNPLIPLWHHAKESKVPAAKSIDVRLVRSGATGAVSGHTTATQQTA